MIYFCCSERRRNAVLQSPNLNGIEFLEVSDDPAAPFEKRQRAMFVHFIKDLAPGALTQDNVRIEGGERIRNIKVIRVTTGEVSSPSGSPPGANMKVLTVEVSEAGDFSTYTLRLVQGSKNATPPAGFDPILSAVDFSFKVACPSDFDCKVERACPTEPVPQPEINYLAKDYASFRQLMLDRMAVLIPQWRERNPADLGMVLIELLAYVGDHLSYQQDAVATESYLCTARRRISVRRHARLVDYLMHDGRNARAWVHARVHPDVDKLALKKGEGRNTTKLLTHIEGLPKLIRQGTPQYNQALAAHPQIFELMDSALLFAAHNEMKFYTWGEKECCLPRGATRATLRDDPVNRLRLCVADVLVLQEQLGPSTGQRADADPARRHAVRLTRVHPEARRVFKVQNDKKEEVDRIPAAAVVDLLTNQPIVEIEWSREDALPFPLYVSARSGSSFFDDVSVALGNIVLADHGMTVVDEIGSTSLDPDTVPAPNPALTKVAQTGGDRCTDHTVKLTPPRYRPTLKQAPLTQAAPYDSSNPPLSAIATMRLSIEDPAQLPLPVINLEEPDVTDRWLPKRDLLNSGPNAKEFVVEVETDGVAYLRFGDDQLGSRPATNTLFLATYRIGNGSPGNLGADTLTHIVSSDAAIISELDNPSVAFVTNPMPTEGGIDPETIEQVRQNAPSAFRRQERAVTPVDYAEVAGRCGPDVQRAAATFRWTGSWRTVFLTVDRLGGAEIDEEFEKNMRRCLERYRMAGHDVEVDGPRYVSLEIEMIVCVKRNYFTSDVKAALLEVFSNRILPNGRRGVFHPDNFTFGQTVYISSLYAAAQEVAGVDSVDITKFQRQGVNSNEALDAGKLELGRLGIARLDNDPDFRERGFFNLIMRGGR
ncbi:MAG: putative baseplate assembly protein [Blastocatellia bacterium]